MAATWRTVCLRPGGGGEGESIESVNDVLIPQDLDYPGLELNIDREHAALLGISPQAAIDNVITALTSDTMIAPASGSIPRPATTIFSACNIPTTRSRR